MTVVIPSMMRNMTSGAGSVEVEGATLKEVLGNLNKRCPGILERLLDENGKLQDHIAFFVDGVEVRASAGLLAPVKPDGEIVIVPALSGGSPPPGALGPGV